MYNSSTYISYVQFHAHSTYMYIIRQHYSAVYVGMAIYSFIYHTIASYMYKSSHNPVSEVDYISFYMA